MWKLLLAVAAFGSAPAFAQADGGVSGDVDDVRRDVDKKVEAAKKEMRDEIRAQLATQSVAQGWQEEWVEQNRKLELFEISGYYRVRPDLFNKFDLNRQPDPDGYTLWPNSPYSPRERTQTGANMRLRLEPTLNVSEEVRIKMQMDVFDNLVFGSTPDYAFIKQERDQFGVFSMSQASPVPGVNSSTSSIDVKRVWGEVSTPVGILRFGRMGSHWGLGMLHNDGNCLDCDKGETVDRVMFVAEPLSGYYVTPMFDMNVSGLTTANTARQTNAPQELSNSDDSKSYILAVARRDTDQQAKAKLENGQAVFNYGVHFTYRIQHDDPVDFYNAPYGSYPYSQLCPKGICQTPSDINVGGLYNGGFVERQAQLYMPDIWIKYERKDFRIEAELAAILGNITNRALQGSQANNPAFTQSLSIQQWAGVLQGEYRLLDGNLRIGLEFGYASGDNSYGFGNFQNRVVGTGPDHNTVPGDIDGPKYSCNSAGAPCADNTINNFRFAQDYRIDNILFREILGGVTNALYAKPSVSYQVADGFHIFASAIGSRAIYKLSTPSESDPYLGIELNAGLKYETEDGFFAQLTYAILFPLGGMQNYAPTTAPGTPGLDNAQALRGLAGIRF